MAERWRSSWGLGGKRPFSGQGRLLRGLRAEVNCREGKKEEERERGEREKAGCQAWPCSEPPHSPNG